MADIIVHCMCLFFPVFFVGQCERFFLYTTIASYTICWGPSEPRCGDDGRVAKLPLGCGISFLVSYHDLQNSRSLLRKYCGTFTKGYLLGLPRQVPLLTDRDGHAQVALW